MQRHRFRLQIFKLKDGRCFAVKGCMFQSDQAAQARAAAMHEGWTLARPELGAELYAVIYRLYLPHQPASMFAKVSTRRLTWKPARDEQRRLQTPPGIPAAWGQDHVH